MKGFRISFAVIVAMLLCAGPSHADTAKQEWNFTVSLDDQDIGTHTFTLTHGADKKSWQVVSKANFVATFIDIPVYRYHHITHEDWQNKCLAKLTADTNDDGDVTHVTADGSSSGGDVHAQVGDDTKKAKWNGCLMTFAYWNPALLHQTHLLNPQTGDIENVTITQQPDIVVTVHDAQVKAKVWRIAGKHEPVEVLSAPDGSWIGLDATLKGDRHLSYRLK